MASQQLQLAYLRSYQSSGAYDLPLPTLPAYISTLSLEPHPYKVRAHGTLMTLQHKEKQAAINHRINSLGARLAKLMDTHIVTILSYLDTDLFTITMTSQYLYIISLAHDGLFRDACSAAFPDALRTNYLSADPRANDDPELTFSWRDQYQFLLNPTRNPRLPPHVPLTTCPAIYSDAIYRSHLCRSILPPPLPTENNSGVTLVNSVTDCSYSTFLNHESSNTPLLLKGVTTGTPLGKWTPQFLTRSQEGYRTTSTQSPHAPSAQFAAYNKYCTTVFSESPYYLFDRSFNDKLKRVGIGEGGEKGWEKVLEEKTPWWRHRTSGTNNSADPNLHSPDPLHKTDLLSTLAPSRPDYEWLIAGPGQSGSAFHIDPNATHAWNMPLSGRKLWIFYPPGTPPPGVTVESGGDDVRMPVTVGEWVACFWDIHRAIAADPASGVLECVAEPGDVLFVPHGWWHSVLNVDDGISVAITSNYISSTNLADSIRFFELNKGQISGCGDRLGENSKEEMGKRFKKGMTEGGEVLKALYEREEERSKKGWGCAAWGDTESAAKTESIMGRAKRQKTEGAAEDKAEEAGSESSYFSFGFM